MIFRFLLRSELTVVLDFWFSFFVSTGSRRHPKIFCLPIVGLDWIGLTFGYGVSTVSVVFGGNLGCPCYNEVVMCISAIHTLIINQRQ